MLVQLLAGVATVTAVAASVAFCGLHHSSCDNSGDTMLVVEVAGILAGVAIL